MDVLDADEECSSTDIAEESVEGFDKGAAMMCRSPIKISNRFYNYKKLRDYSARSSGVVAVPCGQCKNCRINQARIWTNRILMEQCCHDYSCFVTLTYDDEHLPSPADRDWETTPEDLAL